MKVAENSIIDLDILPGKGQGDVVGEAQAMANNPKYAPFPCNHCLPLPLRHGHSIFEWLANSDRSIPPEQREKAKGILANVQNVGGGVAKTAGGAVKGVVDTAGNTVPFSLLFQSPRQYLSPDS